MMGDPLYHFPGVVSRAKRVTIATALFLLLAAVASAQTHTVFLGYDGLSAEDGTAAGTSFEYSFSSGGYGAYAGAADVAARVEHAARPASHVPVYRAGMLLRPALFGRAEPVIRAGVLSIGSRFVPQISYVADFGWHSWRRGFRLEFSHAAWDGWTSTVRGGLFVRF